MGKIDIRRWIGIYHQVDQMIPYWVLSKRDKNISCTAVQKLTYLKQRTDEWENRIKEL